MVAKLQDVAKLAGVSVTTVSRVINNYGSLSDKTINKVHAAMRELNYRPNALARAMQGKSSKFVGLIFPNLTNPFYAELGNAIERQLFELGYKTIIASSAENSAIEHEYLAMLTANQVDGIISSSHNLDIDEYQHVDAPIVSFDRRLSVNIPTVASDNYYGGHLAAQYLVEHGAKEIAILIDEDTSASPTVNRVQGALDYLNHQAVNVTPLDVNAIDITTEFPGQYDAVLATNDVIALEIRQIMRAQGVEPLITGYDGSQLIRRIAPDLVTVVQPVEAIADCLVTTLMKMMQNEEVELEIPPLPVTLANK